MKTFTEESSLYLNNEIIDNIYLIGTLEHVMKKNPTFSLDIFHLLLNVSKMDVFCNIHFEDAKSVLFRHLYSYVPVEVDGIIVVIIIHPQNLMIKEKHLCIVCICPCLFVDDELGQRQMC